MARGMHFRSPGPGFLTLYALVFAGMFASFIPLVSVLLPLKAAAIAGEGARVTLLSTAALGGSAIASFANLLFGTLSDASYRRRGTRRGWIAAGLVLVLPGYALLHWSASPVALFGAVALLQVAINMMFAPVTAVMADEVPDSRKGLVAGLLGAAHPFSSLIAVAVTLQGLGGQGARYAMLCGVIALMVLPFLLLARESGAPESLAPPPRVRRRADFARIWAARLLVQIAGNGLTTYGLFYFIAVLGAGVPGKPSAEDASGQVALVFAGVTLLTLLLTIAAGRASDRAMRRKPFLAAAALLMAAGLSMMAVAGSFVVAAIGYALATLGMSVFLALQSALAMQLLPSAAHRGRDLGLLNLTNTLPAMIAPLLALALSPEKAGFGPWLLLLAGGVLLGGAIALSVRTQD
jgi:MFS family permease